MFVECVGFVGRLDTEGVQIRARAGGWEEEVQVSPIELFVILFCTGSRHINILGAIMHAHVH